MRIIRKNRVDAFIRILYQRASSSVKEDAVHKTVRKIILDVQKNGDKAVRKYTEKYDEIKLKIISVSKSEIKSAAKRLIKNT